MLQSLCLNNSSDSQELTGNDSPFSASIGWCSPHDAFLVALGPVLFLLNGSCYTASLSSCWNRNLTSRNGNMTCCEEEEKSGLVDRYAGIVPPEDETHVQAKFVFWTLEFVQLNDHHNLPCHCPSPRCCLCPTPHPLLPLTTVADGQCVLTTHPWA